MSTFTPPPTIHIREKKQPTVPVSAEPITAELISAEPIGTIANSGTPFSRIFWACVLAQLFVAVVVTILWEITH